MRKELLDRDVITDERQVRSERTAHGEVEPQLPGLDQAHHRRAVNSFVTLARPNCVGSSTAIGEAIRCRGDYRTGKVHLHNAGEARLAGSGVDVAADLRSHSCSSMLRLTPACSAMRAPCSGAYSGHFAIRLPCLPTA